MDISLTLAKDCLGISRIEEETESAAVAGKLKTLNDHAKHWDEIAKTLDPNPV